MQKNKLIDKFNRHLNYLRISITDRCNLRCLYCVPPDKIPKLKHEDILRYEEIIRIVRVGVDLGIKKVRITGGEPLVRKGAKDFLKSLSEIKGLEDISLTTNGVLLKDSIESILSAGIRRINVSLDSLDPQTYKKITGFDMFNRVWAGIMCAHENGLSPIKLNVVPLRGRNDNELFDFANLSFKYPFHIRFIEYMPIGHSDINAQKAIYAPELQERFSKIGNLISVEKGLQDGPAKRFRFEGAKGEIGFITAMTHNFCRNCNRMRLTADGQLRACLLSDIQTDLKTPIRNGCSDEVIAEVLLKAALSKGEAHKLSESTTPAVSSQMSAIGG
ncbi:MAG: GTP 3',8-cyclase MoaA [Desulfobacterales bacterium]|nr:GTP 3',8-cyclase MoaA [Desulfobacterales bacterium]